MIYYCHYMQLNIITDNTYFLGCERRFIGSKYDYHVFTTNHKANYPKGYNPGHQKTNGMPPGLAKKASGGASHGNGGGKNKGNGKGKGHGNGKH